VNKSSWERGFAHGCILKAELVDLAEKVRGQDSVVFGTKPGDPQTLGKLDDDGLPHIGSTLQYGDPFYSYINLNTGQAVVNFYKYVSKDSYSIPTRLKFCSKSWNFNMVISRPGKIREKRNHEEFWKSHGNCCYIYIFF